MQINAYDSIRYTFLKTVSDFLALCIDTLLWCTTPNAGCVLHQLRTSFSLEPS